MPMLTMFLMGLSVKPSQSPERTLFGEGRHLVEDLVDFGDDVFAVDEDGFGLGGAEGDVEDGAVLGGVDLLAGEHGFDVVAEAGLVGELEEELEGFVGDAVLGVVEEEAGGFGGEAGAAGRVGLEEVAKLLGAKGFGVLLKGFPGGAGGQGGDTVGHEDALLLGEAGGVLRAGLAGDIRALWRGGRC